MKPVSKILVLAAFLVSCSSAEIEKTPSDFSVAPNVILDTDIGNSLDDLVALDMKKGMMELTGNPYGRFRVLSLSPDQQLRSKELLLNILGTRID